MAIFFGKKIRHGGNPENAPSALQPETPTSPGGVAARGVVHADNEQPSSLMHGHDMPHATNTAMTYARKTALPERDVPRFPEQIPEDPYPAARAPDDDVAQVRVAPHSEESLVDNLADKFEAERNALPKTPHPILPPSPSSQQLTEQQHADAALAGEPLEDILIALGAKREYVREALKRKLETHEPLPVIVRDMGLVSQEMVARAIAWHTGYDYFSLEDADAMDMADVRRLQEIVGQVRFHYTGFILVGFNGKGGVILAVDTQERVNEARNLFFDYQPSVVIASGQTLRKIYRKHFANTEQAFTAAVAA